MATPAIIGTIATTSFSTATGGTNINLPAGITTGELLCIDVSFENDSTAGSITGWTTDLSANHTNYTNFALYRRSADETEGTTVSLSFGSGGRDAIARAYRMTGVDLAEAIVYATTRGAIADTDPPSVAWGWAGDTQTFAFVTGDDVAITGAPSGYTELYNVVNGKANMALWDKTTPPTASPEDPGVVTMGSNRRWQATTWAIKGAGGGTTFDRAAAITSASTVTATATSTFNRSSAVTSASTVTANAAVTFNRAASIASASTVSAVGSRVINRSATIAAASTVSAVASVTFGRAANIASASTVTAAASTTFNRSATIASASTVSAVATSSSDISRTASIVAASTVTAAPTVTLNRAASIVAASTVSATATSSSDIPRSASISAVSTVSAVATRTLNRSASIASASSTAAIATSTLRRSSQMTSTSLVDAVRRVSRRRSVSIIAQSTVQVTASTGGQSSRRWASEAGSINFGSVTTPKNSGIVTLKSNGGLVSNG